jgi:hypothetical protein
VSRGQVPNRPGGDRASGTFPVPGAGNIPSVVRELDAWEVFRCDAPETVGEQLAGGTSDLKTLRSAPAEGGSGTGQAGTPHWFKEVRAPFLYYARPCRALVEQDGCVPLLKCRRQPCAPALHGAAAREVVTKQRRLERHVCGKPRSVSGAVLRSENHLKCLVQVGSPDRRSVPASARSRPPGRCPSPARSEANPVPLPSTTAIPLRDKRFSEPANPSANESERNCADDAAICNSNCGCHAPALSMRSGRRRSLPLYSV